VFVRKRKNKSGSTSVQIINTSGSKDKLIKTIGFSPNPKKLEELCRQGQAYIDQYRGQQQLSLAYDQDQRFFQRLSQGLQQVQMVGPELIFGKLFDEIGFNQIPDSIFHHLVLSRLVFPLSSRALKSQ